MIRINMLRQIIRDRKDAVIKAQVAPPCLKEHTACTGAQDQDEDDDETTAADDGVYGIVAFIRRR